MLLYSWSRIIAKQFLVQSLTKVISFLSYPRATTVYQRSHIQSFKEGGGNTNSIMMKNGEHSNHLKHCSIPAKRQRLSDSSTSRVAFLRKFCGGPGFAKSIFEDAMRVPWLAIRVLSLSKNSK